MPRHGRDTPVHVTSNAVVADPVSQGFRVHVELPRQPRDHRLRTARSAPRVFPRCCHSKPPSFRFARSNLVRVKVGEQVAEEAAEWVGVQTVG